MSEVKGNSNSNNSTGLLHPTNTWVANATKDSEDPLEVNAIALHPLPKKQPITASHYSASSTAQQSIHEKPKIQFNSANGSKSSQKFNPFAEQNAKRTAKKQHQAKQRKAAFVVSSVIGAVTLLAGVVWVVILVLQNHTPNATEDNAPTVIFSQDTVTEDMNNLRELAFEAYNPAVETDSDGEISLIGTLSSAEQVFDKAESAPQNKNYLNQIKVSKAIFYAENGFYDLAIQTVNDTDVEKLTVEQRVALYNFASIAYYGIGEKDESNAYTELAREEASKLEGYGE